VEPLPTRDNRQSILFYEAAEGGAGVLTRIANEPDALAKVAAQALEIMHFEPPGNGAPWKRDALTELLDAQGKPICEAGCYKCLLSYYNQPDHPLIDRKDAAAEGLVLDILCRLTGAQARAGSRGRSPEEHADQLSRLSGSALERAWLAHVERHGHRKPDRAQHLIEAAGTRADFFYDDFQLAVFIDGPHHETERRKAQDADIDRKLEDLGLLVVRFPKETGQWPEIFESHADLFGAAK